MSRSSALAAALALIAGVAGAAHSAATAAATTLAPGQSPAMRPEPPGMVRRTTLIVHDLDASIRFYRDVLGFELWLENRGRVTATSLPNEAPVGAESRFAIMKGRHPWIGMVGLLQYGEPRPLPPKPRVLKPGDAVLMIETEDLAGIWSRMQRAGTPIHRPPQTSEVSGAGGAQWQATFLFAYDPDGHMLEINERTPATAVPAPATAAPGPATAASGNPTAVGTVASSGVPPRIRRAFFDGRYGQLHYRRATPTQPVGLRAPVVLLHQSPLSGRMYSELQPRLATDRVVYALDTPGYGESDPPPSLPALGDYAEALHDFIAELKEPVELVGYHTGALIAAEIAARHPASIRRLVLISVPIFDAERRARLGSMTSQNEDGSHLLKEWQSTMSVRPPGQSLELAARIVAEKQRAGLKAGWAMAAIAGYEPEPRLRSIARPTLVIRPKDGLQEPSALAASWIPGARLEDAPQWSFGLFDAQPDAVAATLRRFLDAR